MIFFLKTVAGNKKKCTFAHELIGQVILTVYNSLVISFSVINYVVSMRLPREMRRCLIFFCPILNHCTELLFFLVNFGDFVGSGAKPCFAIS